MIPSDIPLPPSPPLNQIGRILFRISMLLHPPSPLYRFPPSSKECLIFFGISQILGLLYPSLIILCPATQLAKKKNSKPKSNLQVSLSFPFQSLLKSSSLQTPPSPLLTDRQPRTPPSECQSREESVFIVPRARFLTTEHPSFRSQFSIPHAKICRLLLSYASVADTTTASAGKGKSSMATCPKLISSVADGMPPEECRYGRRKARKKINRMIRRRRGEKRGNQDLD